MTRRWPIGHLLALHAWLHARGYATAQAALDRPGYRVPPELRDVLQDCAEDEAQKDAVAWLEERTAARRGQGFN